MCVWVDEDELKDDDPCAPPLELPADEPAPLEEVPPLVAFPAHPARAKQAANAAKIIFLFILFVPSCFNETYCKERERERESSLVRGRTICF